MFRIKIYREKYMDQILKTCLDLCHSQSMSLTSINEKRMVDFEIIHTLLLIVYHFDPNYMSLIHITSDIPCKLHGFFGAVRVIFNTCCVY